MNGAQFVKRRQYLNWGGALAIGSVLGGQASAVLAQPSNGDVLNWWSRVWPGLAGEGVAMRHFLGRPLLVNFWATWCPPCVQELPLLNAFYREQQARGWQVLALAVDRPEAVQRFRQQHPLEIPVALLGPEGVEVSRSLGNHSGGLPYTVIFNANGEWVANKSGRVLPSDLRRWAA